MEDKTKSGKRGSNWTPEEKECLVDLIELHIKDIEDKRTDGNVTKRKEAAWRKIHEQFTVSQGSREVKRMKELWKRIKDAAKKEYQEYKKESKKTGGGPGPDDLSNLTLRILNLIPREFQQYTNPYDDDAIQMSGHDKEQIGPLQLTADNGNKVSDIEEDIPIVENEIMVNEVGLQDKDIEDKDIGDGNPQKNSELPLPQHSGKSEDNRRLQTQAPVRRKAQTDEGGSTKKIKSFSPSSTKILDIEHAILKLSQEEHALKMDILRKEHSAKMKLLHLHQKLTETKLSEAGSSSYT
ncbi:hypothetical protein SNE40_020847 [Patella caerulea]|uniref:Myb-like domain-containing protein n=1 Tax=Patella caerulea TaxID=87958 RepID=A0AAN8P7U2_PATCE